jgi:hypothetical protein
MQNYQKINRVLSFLLRTEVFIYLLPSLSTSVSCPYFSCLLCATVRVHCYQYQGCTIAQSVIHRLFTTEAQVPSQRSSCRLCGGQSDTGTRCSQGNSVFSCPLSFYRCSIFICLSSKGRPVGRLEATIPTYIASCHPKKKI